jgi:hypothetical protein
MKPSRKKLLIRTFVFVVAAFTAFFVLRPNASDADDFYFPGIFAVLFAFLAMTWSDIPLEDLRARYPSDAWARIVKRASVVTFAGVAVVLGLISLAKLSRLFPDFLHRN